MMTRLFRTSPLLTLTLMFWAALVLSAGLVYCGDLEERYSRGTQDIAQLALLTMSSVTPQELAEDQAPQDLIKLYSDHRAQWTEALSSFNARWVGIPLYENEGNVRQLKAAIASPSSKSVDFSAAFVRAFGLSAREAFVLVIHETGHILGVKDHDLLDRMGNLMAQKAGTAQLQSAWPGLAATPGSGIALNREFEYFTTSAFQKGEKCIEAIAPFSDLRQSTGPLADLRIDCAADQLGSIPTKSSIFHRPLIRLGLQRLESTTYVFHSARAFRNLDLCEKSVKALGKAARTLFDVIDTQITVDCDPDLFSGAVLPRLKIQVTR